MTRHLLNTLLALACLSEYTLHSQGVGDFTLFAGYRQDTQSLSVCSGLNTPEYFGGGKLRGRQLHIWEVGAHAACETRHHLGVEGQISYGKLLGGEIRDSGIADILANPFNSVIALDYGECCAPCTTESFSCVCPCTAGRTLAPSIGARASAKGEVWDLLAGLSYRWTWNEHFHLRPCIGYAYDRQRLQYHHATWGPVRADYILTPCDATLFNELTGIYLLEDDTNTLALTNNPETFFVSDAVLPGKPRCVTFGDCLDGTTYTSSWNGGYLGLLAGAVYESFGFELGYRFYLQHYSGRFSTFGGCDGQCDCAGGLCPLFYAMGGGENFTTEPREFQEATFLPGELAFQSLAVGQEVFASLEYRCNAWVAALYGGWQYRYAGKCSNNPCDSPHQILNGHMALEPDSGIGVTTILPTWTDANMVQARWSAARLGVSLTRLF